MKLSEKVTITLAASGCLVALAISVYPGVLNDLMLNGILLSLTTLPVMGLVVLVAFIGVARRGELRAAYNMLQGIRIPFLSTAAVLVLLFGTYVLLKFYVPRRVAFAASRAAFEQLVSQAPSSVPGQTPLNRRLGVYNVEAYAADPRGGVYFQLYDRPVGMGIDSMSYGFVYNPNQQGTPFGAADYRVYRLGDDWYWFHACNDWY